MAFLPLVIFPLPLFSLSEFGSPLFSPLPPPSQAPFPLPRPSPPCFPARSSGETPAEKSPPPEARRRGPSGPSRSRAAVGLGGGRRRGRPPRYGPREVRPPPGRGGGRRGRPVGRGRGGRADWRAEAPGLGCLRWSFAGRGLWVRAGVSGEVSPQARDAPSVRRGRGVEGGGLAPPVACARQAGGGDLKT